MITSLGSEETRRQFQTVGYAASEPVFLLKWSAVGRQTVLTTELNQFKFSHWSHEPGSPILLKMALSARLQAQAGIILLVLFK